MTTTDPKKELSSPVASDESQSLLKGTSDAVNAKVQFRGVILSSILMSVLGGFIFGYNTGVIAGALDPLDDAFGISTTIREVVTGSILVGAMAGSLFSGALADMFGRKKLMIVFSFISIASIAVLATAPSILVVIISRGVLGLSVGGFSYVCPLYSGETSPPAIRGLLTAIIQLSVVFSAFIGYLVNLAFQNMEEGWRYMFGIGGVPCIFALFISIFQVVESPRWLVNNGREEEAKPLLKQIIGDKLVEQAINDIKKSAKAAAVTAGWTEVFSWKLRKQLFLGLILCVANQLTGNNGVTYYAPRIFEQAGYDSGTVAVAATAGVGFWKFLAMGLVLLLRVFDKYGRRTMMLAGLTVMGTGAAVLGISFQFLPDDVLAPVAIICIFWFCAGFQMGPGPLFYVLNSEVFPDNVRGRAMSLVNAVQWSFNLLLSLRFVTVIDAIGTGPTFFIFFGVCGFCVMMIYFICPETKGKTLDEIQTMLSEENDAEVSNSKEV